MDWFYANFNNLSRITALAGEVEMWREWLGKMPPQKARSVSATYFGYVDVQMVALEETLRLLREDMLCMLVAPVAARKIQRAFRRSVSDPTYAMARKRLMAEWAQMCIELP